MWECTGIKIDTENLVFGPKCCPIVTADSSFSVVNFLVFLRVSPYIMNCGYNDHFAQNNKVSYKWVRRYIRNSKGPRMLPWGIPEVRSQNKEIKWWWWSTTRYVCIKLSKSFQGPFNFCKLLAERKLWCHDSVKGSRQWADNFENKRVCATQSKALAKSKKMQ